MARLLLNLPDSLHAKLKEVAAGDSPPNTVTREIIERLTASFEQAEFLREQYNIAAENHRAKYEAAAESYTDVIRDQAKRIIASETRIAELEAELAKARRGK